MLFGKRPFGAGQANIDLMMAQGAGKAKLTLEFPSKPQYVIIIITWTTFTTPIDVSPSLQQVIVSLFFSFYCQSLFHSYILSLPILYDSLFLFSSPLSIIFHSLHLFNM